MNRVAEILTTVFGVVLIGAIAYEIKRRRRHLRERYNVLDEEDKDVVAALDRMVAAGLLQPVVRE